MPTTDDLTYPVSLTPPDISAYRAGNTGVEYVHQFDSGKPGSHVMVSAVVRAHSLVSANPPDRSPYTLADLFCRQSRARIRDRFDRLFANNDSATYEVAQQTMKGMFEWVEEGLVGEDWIPSPEPASASSTAPVAPPVEVAPAVTPETAPAG